MEKEIEFYARRADGLAVTVEVWPEGYRPSSVKEALERLQAECEQMGYEGGSRLTGEVWTNEKVLL